MDSAAHLTSAQLSLATAVAKLNISEPDADQLRSVFARGIAFYLSRHGVEDPGETEEVLHRVTTAIRAGQLAALEHLSALVRATMRQRVDELGQRRPESPANEESVRIAEAILRRRTRGEKRAFARFYVDGRSVEQCGLPPNELRKLLRLCRDEFRAEKERRNTSSSPAETRAHAGEKGLDG